MFQTDFIMSGHQYIQNFLIRKNTVPNASAVVFRKKYYNSIGGATIEFKTTGDWDIWLKLALQGQVAYFHEPLNYFRQHTSSVIGKHHSNKNRITRNLLSNSYIIQLRRSWQKLLNKSSLAIIKIKIINQKLLFKSVLKYNLFKAIQTFNIFKNYINK